MTGYKGCRDIVQEMLQSVSASKGAGYIVQQRVSGQISLMALHFQKFPCVGERCLIGVCIAYMNTFS